MFRQRKHKPIHEPPIPAVARLAEVRMAWGLSVQYVAEKLGCSPCHLRKCERGQNDPSGKLLVKWAEILGYEISLWPKQVGK